jgi:hypothetical protein
LPKRFEGDEMIYRDSDLLKNILLFSQLLRKKKVGVTIDNILDALRGIPFIDIQEKKDFYYLLKSNFISNKDEMEYFDELFEQFWSFKDRPQTHVEKTNGKEVETINGKETVVSNKYEKDRFQIEDWTDEIEENELKEQKNWLAYSPEEILRRKNFDFLKREELEKIKEWIFALTQKVAVNLTRRWKQGKRGDHIDFRRSVRHSVKYGGELIELKMKRPKPKPFRIVLLCDVSGSMDIYSQFFILFMYNLQNHYPHCETFAFSTRLSHITALLKRRDFEESLRLLSKSVLGWSGGTNIGVALHQLSSRYSRLLHPKRTLFFIFSDGWDLGDTELLDSEMKNLKKQVRKMIWLNPLLASPGYKPLCKGMSTALPYLDHFFPCHNFSNLRKLGAFISAM